MCPLKSILPATKFVNILFTAFDCIATPPPPPLTLINKYLASFTPPGIKTTCHLFCKKAGQLFISFFSRSRKLVKSTTVFSKRKHAFYNFCLTHLISSEVRHKLFWPFMPDSYHLLPRFLLIVKRGNTYLFRKKYLYTKKKEKIPPSCISGFQPLTYLFLIIHKEIILFQYFHLIHNSLTPIY